MPLDSLKPLHYSHSSSRETSCAGSWVEFQEAVCLRRTSFIIYYQYTLLMIFVSR